MIVTVIRSVKLLRTPKIITILESSIKVSSQFFYLKWWPSNHSEGYSNPTVKSLKFQTSSQQCYRNLRERGVLGNPRKFTEFPKIIRKGLGVQEREKTKM